MQGEGGGQAEGNGLGLRWRVGSQGESTMILAEEEQGAQLTVGQRVGRERGGGGGWL